MKQLSIRSRLVLCVVPMVLLMAGCGSRVDDQKYDYEKVSYKPKVFSTTKSFDVGKTSIPAVKGQEKEIEISGPVKSKEKLIFRGTLERGSDIRLEKPVLPLFVRIFAAGPDGKRVVHSEGIATVRCDKQASVGCEVIVPAPFQGGLYQVEVICDGIVVAQGKLQTSPPSH